MWINRGVAIVEKTLGVVAGFGFLSALALNFANVVMRYLFSSPIFWAEEVMVLLTVWCVFLGAVIVALRGEHLSVQLLDWLLPTGPRQVLKISIHLITTVVCGYVAWRAAELVELVARLQQTTIVGEIPMTFAYGAVLAGTAGIALASLLKALHDAGLVGLEHRNEERA